MNNKLHIITGYTENIKQLSDLSYDSLQKYCSLHNINHTRYLITETDRPPSWYKVKLILSEFQKGAEYVMWVDSDTTVINFDFNILDLLDESEIYLSKDINGINCGIMIWKKSDISIEILNKVWSLTEFINHNWWEQAAFRSLYDINFNNLQNITKIINQHDLNSYDYNLYGMNYPEGQWSASSFLIHFPGLSNERRIQLINQFKEQYDISN